MSIAAACTQPAQFSAPTQSATKATTAPASAAATPGRWTFDTDATGGLPTGAQAFTGQLAMRVEVQANQFRGFLNGQQVADSSDDTYRSGGIGVWTKADSVTCFDDVQLTAR